MIDYHDGLSIHLVYRRYAPRRPVVAVIGSRFLWRFVESIVVIVVARLGGIVRHQPRSASLFVDNESNAQNPQRIAVGLPPPSSVQHAVVFVKEEDLFG